MQIKNFTSEDALEKIQELLDMDIPEYANDDEYKKICDVVGLDYYDTCDDIIDEEYLKNRFGENAKFITKEIPIYAQTPTVSIAGTMDMVVIDENDDIHIFDFKTSKHKELSIDDKNKYLVQQKMYSAILETYPGIKGKIKSINLLVAKTDYSRNVEKSDDGNFLVDGVLASQSEDFTPPQLSNKIEDSIIELNPDDSNFQIPTFFIKENNIQSSINAGLNIASLNLNAKNTSVAPINTVDIDKMDRLFTVKERKDRTSFLTKRFMQYMDAFIAREEKQIKEKLSKASSPQERKALLLELYSIDPFTILKKYSPEAVMDEIKKELRWYSTDRTRMRQIWEKKLNYLNSLRKKSYSQEELESKIDDYTDKAMAAYSKMIDNEDILIEMMEDAFVELEQLLGVRMSFKNVSKNLTDSETNDYGENMSEEETVMAKEETTKDNWQIKVKSISSFSKISFKVRRVLGTLPKVNNNGKTETDDLLNEKYLSISNVHAFLVDVLKDITHPNDIIPILEEQSKTKKWLKPVITKLKTDNIFFSQFYTNYRLDFDNMWAITVDNYSDGHITHKTKSLNNTSIGSPLF